MGILVLIAAGAALLVVATSTILVHRMIHPARKTYAHALAVGLLTSPEELGYSYQEHRFRFRDGSTTLGWVIQGQKPDGPIVVMTHGWESCIYSSLVKAPLFVPHASKLVLYDMRGHGESTSRICRLGTVEADDILEIIEQLEDANTPIVLFGSSMGAGISIVAAAKSALAETRSCLANQFPDESGATVKALRRPCPGRTHGLRRALTVAPAIYQAGPSCVGRIRGVVTEAPYRYGMEPIYGHFKEQGFPSFPAVRLAYLFLMLRLRRLWRFDRVGYASQLDCPLLVLHGTADPISRYESGRQIAAAANRGQLVTFDGGTHGDLAEIDPGKYITALAEFFRDLGFADRH